MRKQFVPKVLQSATKIVLLILTVSLVVLTFYWIVGGDMFMTICVMVFSFYFKDSTTTAKKDLDENDKQWEL